MIVLGINPNGIIEAFGGGLLGGHDGSAALVENGEIRSMVEEERFTRVKRAPMQFPERSIEYVLTASGYDLSDVDVIAVGRDIEKFALKQSIYSTPGRQDLRKIEEARRAVKGEIDALDLGEFDGHYEWIAHHRAHAASASYCSPFEAPVTITVDDAGEFDSTVIWDGDLNRYETFEWPNSLGKFWAKLVQNILGYRDGRDAGKAMGLAPYGEKRPEFLAVLDEMTSYGDGSYDVTTLTGTHRIIPTFEREFGPVREHPEPFEKHHKDVAWAFQHKLEEILSHLVTYYAEELDESCVALAGGVAMNCKANRVLMNLDAVEDLFIQPAATDVGTSLGAALEGYRMATGEVPDPEFEHVYYGPQYSNDEIRTTLGELKLSYHEGDVCEKAAKLLADGAIVGWFQGRMEFGPRALGNRSILANPTKQRYADAVNENVKDREVWRPFAPSILDERQDEYLVHDDDSPFMILADSVVEEKQGEIPAVTHVDGTARPQTVREETNPKYHWLLRKFEEETGIPVLLNTSFNLSGEPIVESPEQAIRDFYSTGMDALVLNDCILYKDG